MNEKSVSSIVSVLLDDIADLMGLPRKSDEIESEYQGGKRDMDTKNKQEQPQNPYLLSN